MTASQLATLRAWYAAKGLRHLHPDGGVLSCAPTAAEHHVKVNAEGRPYTQPDWSKLGRRQGEWPDS